MNEVERAVRGAVMDFLDAYLVRRNLEDVLNRLSAHVLWVGTGEGETAFGYAAVENLLRDELHAAPDSFEFCCPTLDVEALSDARAMTLASLLISQSGTSIEVRMTMHFALENGAWKVTSMHGSTAEKSQVDGAFFPVSDESVDPGDFARHIGYKTLDLLERNIPGGILGVYVGKDYPIYYINNRMLEYLGYETREEFMEITHGSYLNCLPPEDREWVVRMVEKATLTSEEFVVQYRIYKRDGSTIWVSDTGRRGMAVDGRELTVSVVRDITDEMSRRERLEREAREKAEQAEKYDRLFQSVLCGIVQYRIHPTGELDFINANREAIRLFGYTAEEFWAKKDWNLPSLIDAEDRERVLGEVQSLHNVGDKKTYEYRLAQQDGTPCWIIGSAEILARDGDAMVVQSVFLDIDTQKRAEYKNRILEEQVEASHELFRLALEHTTTCECYYNPQKQRLLMPRRAVEHYSARSAYDNMPESFALERVEPEFRDAFCSMLRSIGEGERTASVEFRVCGESLWCRATFSVLRSDEQGESVLAVGLLEDITKQKEMERALEDAHARDGLTGLYNREYGVKLVQECLMQRPAGESYAMMLLDMDDFGRLSHEEGNTFADALLQEVADVLATEAGDTGICVRLGGDEFMLLLRGCTKADAGVIGPRIAAQVKRIFARPEKALQLSVSIGMCVTTVADEYTALYRCAETTLQYIKEHKKGEAACYLDVSNAIGMRLTSFYTDAHNVNDIDRSLAYKGEDLVSFALDLLGKSKNMDDAVFLLFARVGKAFGLDRVSIVEANHSLLSFVTTHQWARNPARLHVGKEWYVEEEEFERFATAYDEDGLSERRLFSVCSPDVSYLHAGIWDYGEYMGLMCFEVEEPHYAWSERQRKLLQEFVRIVPSFLMKVRADAVSRAKTEFLSRMSHEIRTPMNAISGMTSIAKRVLDDREKAMDCLNKIESANSYLLELINDILDMSRIESGKLELNAAPMDLDEQLNKIESLFVPQAREKRITLRFEKHFDDTRPLLGDALRLNQVLINIIGNAVKFTPEGGEITVSVERKADSSRAALKFSVRDTGIGIDSADTRRIFNAFEQAERDTAASYGGTGLGLAISSRLVQLMGGQLEVESTVGEGSNFYFTVRLPYAAAPVTRAAAPSTTPLARSFAGTRVLVAEDNALNLEIVRTILEMNDFTVTCALNGAEALEIFTAAESGAFDVILMDIRMPVMDGLEATRRIRTSGHPDARSIPIIALTANAFDEDSRRSIENGMNAHLSKPLEIDKLFEALEACLHHKE